MATPIPAAGYQHIFDHSPAAILVIATDAPVYTILDVNQAYLSSANVTELDKLAERERAGVEALKNQREQLYSFFMQAPVGIAIFRGPDYIVDLINPPLCEVYDQTVDDMLGKPVFEVLHHAKGL